MYDLIPIGNISIDLYFQGETLTHKRNRFSLAIGGKYNADYFYESLGGGGANVAIGAARHGLKSAILGKIGNNQFKKMILAHLDEHGVSEKLCTFKDEYLKISSILLSPSGERTIINYETPHEHIFETEEELNQLKNAKYVYVSNLPRVPLEERNHMMTFLNKNRIPVVLNLGIKDCRRPFHQIIPMLNKTDILILNSHEFCEMTKHSYEAIDFKKDVRKYIGIDFKKTLIVTDGEKGSHAYWEKNVHHMAALPPKRVVDTTGAGDGYTAGFISGIIKHEGDIVKAMETGAKYALKIIEKVGAN